jgi:hypothetical protein
LFELTNSTLDTLRRCHLALQCGRTATSAAAAFSCASAAALAHAAAVLALATLPPVLAEAAAAAVLGCIGRAAALIPPISDWLSPEEAMRNAAEPPKRGGSRH